MGCGTSVSAYKRVYIVDENRPGQGKAASNTFARLGLNEEAIQMFYNKFCDIDKDESAEIDLDEFYRYFQLPRTPFADRVFSIMDEDGSGEIDFREFVACIWNYCTFDLKALIKFAFSMFDLDGSGVLEAQEVRNLVEEVYGDGYKNNVRVQRIVEKIDKDDDGDISFDEFNSFNRQYPALLFPAFSMQMTLRERCFGEGYWKKLTIKRHQQGSGRAKSIFEILNDMDVGEYKRKLDNMVADEAGGRWNAPTMEEQRENMTDKMRRKADRKAKKATKGVSISVSGKNNERNDVMTSGTSLLAGTKRKSRRRRGTNG